MSEDRCGKHVKQLDNLDGDVEEVAELKMLRCSLGEWTWKEEED